MLAPGTTTYRQRDEEADRSRNWHKHKGTERVVAVERAGVCNSRRVRILVETQWHAQLDRVKRFLGRNGAVKLLLRRKVPRVDLEQRVDSAPHTTCGVARSEFDERK
jgi:hypothetical protein